MISFSGGLEAADGERGSLARTVYVIGHKNPDTDSVAAATAYAELKRALGMAEARAARAGAANPQTEYIFDRFSVELPEFVPDLIPKVKYYLSGEAPTVRFDTPLWEALALMGLVERKVLPIVDAEGHYESMLHYGAFAENILTKINPHKKAIIPTSIAHLLATIKAQPIVTYNEETFFKARIVVAALETRSFLEHLHGEPVENTVVIVGDREDVQRIAIESGVRAVVIINGNVISKELRELAEERHVSVLISPYDTSSTALLVIYSTPVWTMGDTYVPTVQFSDSLSSASAAIKASPSRSVAVLDDEGRVMNVFAEGDLINEPNIEVILVDHNELTLAVEGVENYNILEVIDHHRIGALTTKSPITFLNRVVGATCTIVANIYREFHVPIPRQIASILLCGILSDTLVLKSVTTTDADRETAEYLANITDLEIDSLGRDIMGPASGAARLPVEDMIGLDMKEYEASGEKITVSQIEVTNNDELLGRTESITSALRSLREQRGLYLAALIATDITNFTSLLFVDADKSLYVHIGYPKIGEGVYVLRDILSRKKQLMPTILELMKKAKEE
ncbi:MAG TPA: putative manganese-dependent inorganic diphosphatase [Methanoregulaceae archaeon]|nr:putative manganese-dependent inorganic diphosphatase [Methanoregulaceae archaeon]